MFNILVLSLAFFSIILFRYRFHLSVDIQINFRMNVLLAIEIFRICFVVASSLGSAMQSSGLYIH